MENFPAASDILLVLLFGAVLPLVSGLQSKSLFSGGGWVFTSVVKIRFYLQNSLMLSLGAGMVLLNWVLHERDTHRLGFQWVHPENSRSLIVLILLFLLLYVTDLWFSFGKREERRKQLHETASRSPFLPLKARELPAYLIMCCAAATGEELIYRGFLITFFMSFFHGMTGAATYSILVPGMLFSAAHFYQGAKAVFKIMVLSTLFGMIFLNSGSLLIVAFLHFMVDWCSGLAYWYLSKKAHSSDRV